MDALTFPVIANAITRDDECNIAGLIAYPIA
jgi:hypothetical protein